MERTAVGQQVVVLDTSVIVKWFFPEEDSEIATNILKAYNAGSIEIFAPVAAAYELTNVLWLKRKIGLTRQQAQDILADFYTFELSLVYHVGMLHRALVLAFQLDIAVYDAVFVALAKALNCDFITADKVLWHKVKNKEPRVKLLSVF